MAFDNNDWTLAATDDTTANEALETVEKVEHHFWADEEGAHVSVDGAIAPGVKNFLVDSDSANIRSGEDVLASFSENMVELGKNSSDAKIKMLDGKGTISYENQGGRLRMATKAEGANDGCSTDLLAEKDTTLVDGSVYHVADVSVATAYFKDDADFASAALHASRNRWNYVEQTDEIDETNLSVSHDGIYVTKNRVHGDKSDYRSHRLFEWEQLGQVQGADNVINIDMSEYSELMIVCSYGTAGTVEGTSYLGSIVLPAQQLTTNFQEVYLPGGYYSSGSGRHCYCNVSKTQVKGCYLRADSTDRVRQYTTVYAR